MKNLAIIKPAITLQLSNFHMKGECIIEQIRKIKDLAGVFFDNDAYGEMDNEQIIYSVQSWFPVEEGTEGGLFWGNTTIMPGKVGDEYFMTKGHFHSKRESAEIYFCIEGNGMLILMDQNRKCWGEEMYPGSLHYIPGNVAHRTANIGNSPLTFGACWPADAGHNYEEIQQEGFSARLFEKAGKPILIETKERRK